jgi:hypothetical protein
MRFQFKTSYNQDMPVPRRVGATYGLLALAVLALPLLISEYYVGESTWVFIYAHRRHLAGWCGRLHRAWSSGWATRSSASALTPTPSSEARHAVGRRWCWLC